MRTTIDTYTGKAFRWNTVALALDADGNLVNVPARITNSAMTHLHPARVQPALLARLNSDDNSCVHCGTPIALDADGVWWHDEECPEDSACYRGDKEATP